VKVRMPRKLVFDAAGLLPVVVQDRASGDVLMVAFANAKALKRTAVTGTAHFWSRSRKRLWKKGQTSGNRLRVREVRADCDRDALLMVVDPEGPACHNGTRACFGDLTRGSYTARLLGKGLDHSLKKVGEEATEVVLAGKAESDERLAEESADLLFHLLVVLRQRGLAPSRVMDVLRRRRGAR
jgi:phosphoribosyl-ATP pyrophosphohydrolase/phosphoribosyl-AMP cyclohydrolase